MTERGSFKCPCRWVKVVRETASRLRRCRFRLVADGAVVVLLNALVLRAACGMSRLKALVETFYPRDYVLMFVVRKDCVELPRLIGLVENKARFVARRDFGMADGADGWPRSFEKFRPMTARARGMRGIIRHVRKSGCCGPIGCRSLVAGRTVKAFVFGRAMREGGIISRRLASFLRLTGFPCRLFFSPVWSRGLRIRIQSCARKEIARRHESCKDEDDNKASSHLFMAVSLFASQAGRGFSTTVHLASLVFEMVRVFESSALIVMSHVQRICLSPTSVGNRLVTT